MFKENKYFHLLFFILAFTFIVFSISCFLGMPLNEAQNWALMPPYNVLWPLWSPVLSPVDPITGLKIPLISTLTTSTILPLQPGLVWDPSQGAPWPIYNKPLAFGGGLLYFDRVYGLNNWPPPYLIDPITGAPAPITYLITYSLLLPTSLGELEYLIPSANLAYSLSYGITGPAFLNLLQAADIWGLPPI